MYCPKCATHNLDAARFCRSCGADISLVPQALTGRLPERPAAETGEGSQTAHARRKHRGKKEPSLEKGIETAFIGIGFLLVAVAVAFFAPAGRLWWFWMLIPAFAMLGGGVAEIVRVRLGQSSTVPRTQSPFGPPPDAAVPPAPRASALPPRDTGELVPPPPSVTEGTTRHLGAEGPTKHFGAPADGPRKTLGPDS